MAAACLDVFPDVQTEYGLQLDLPTFLTSNASDNINVQAGSTLDLSEGQYGSISSNGTVNFTTEDGVYRINNLTAQSNSTLNFKAGDYYIQDLSLSNGSVINGDASGTVRIYINGNTNIQDNVSINNSNHELIIIGYNSLNMGKYLEFKGSIYATGTLTIQEHMNISGAITASTLNLTTPNNSPSNILNYDSTRITEADFNGMCSGVVEACSPYVGDATLNEFYKQGGNSSKPVFIEVSLIDYALSDSTYDDWGVRLCYDNSGSNDCKIVPLSEMDDSSTWLWDDDSSLRDYLDFQSGFDAALIDGNGAFIDYIQVYDYDGQNFTDSCSYDELDYVFEIPDSISNGTVILMRTPDSTGMWIEDKNTTKFPPSPGESNDTFVPQLEYLFDEGTGQDVFDSSVFGRDGVLGLNGNEVEDKDPSWTCEADGYYLTFDASDDDRVSVDEFTPPTEVSIAFWMKVPSMPTNTERIFGMGPGWEARWAYDDDNNLRVYFDINYDDNQPYNDYAIRTDTSFTSSQAGQWIHFAFVGSMTTGDWSIYLNGSEDSNGNVTFVEQPDNKLGDLWLGGRSGNNSEFLNGSLEEFRIYSGLLTQEAITSLSTNTPQGCAVDNFIAFYPFEQDSFDSGIENINTGDFTATNEGGESTADGRYCRGFDSNGSNNANITNNAFDTHLDINDDIGDEGTVNFWFNSKTDWDDNKERRMLFDASLKEDQKYFYLEIEGENDGDGSKRLRFKFEDDEDNDYTVAEAETGAVEARSPNTWYFISVTWSLVSNTFKIYVDGTEVASSSSSTSGSFGNLGSIVFGDNSDSKYGNGDDGSKRSSNGLYDEVRIYKEVRTQEQIQADMNDNGCGAGVIDHYEIHHDATGFTCEPEAITVKACTSDVGEICEESTDVVNLTLVASNSYTVTKALEVIGSEDTEIKYTKAELVTLSIPDASPVECIEKGSNNSTDCTVNFVETGFRFLSGGSEDLPTQLSGKPSNTGYNSLNKAWELQAVIDDGTGTGTCESALSGDIDVGLRAICTTPNTCADMDVNITGSGSAKDIATTSAGAASTYTQVTLNFGDNSDSTAGFVFKYPDAGQLQLEAQYLIPPDPENTSSDLPTQYMEGTSNPFVVKPFGFYLDNIVEAADTDNENPKAENASGDKFISAGTEFNVNITAKQWKSGQDTNGNGIHDDGDDISLNGKTPNFNDVVKLTHTLAELTPAVIGLALGELSVTNNQGTEGIFSAGVATLTAKYSEVGIIELLVDDDGDYINGVTDIKGNEPYVGRFIPDYFAQFLEDEGELTANHNTTCAASDWAYAGQKTTEAGSTTGVITYKDLMAPEIKVTAYNADREVTTNYTIGDFMKLTAGDVHKGLISPENDNAKLRVDEADGGETVEITAESSMLEGVLSIAPDDGGDPDNGVMLYTYNSADDYIYEHNENSLLSHFPAVIPFDIRTDSSGGDLIEDSDGVTLGIDPSDSTKRLIESFTTAGVEIYFGRWFIENAFGPETSDLVVPMYMQYYVENDETNAIDGVFQTNTLDNCTIPLLEDKVLSGDIHSGNLTPWDYRLLNDEGSIDPDDDTDASILIPLTVVENGEYREFNFSAPNTRGKLLLEYEVPAWFKYNWLDDDDDLGEFVDNPTATITFGLYRGNDRIISWREVSN